MGLKELVLADEPEIEISYVEITAPEDDTDPELPSDFVRQDDLDLLEDTATALEALGSRIGCEGMSLSTARDLDAIMPGFIRNSGGNHCFTGRPSLEGLQEGIKSIQTKLMDLIRRVREFVADMYKRFKAWLVAKFNKPTAQDVTPEVGEFVAKRKNRDAMAFMGALPEKPEEAAAEIALLVDGDSKAFESACVDAFQTLSKNVKSIETAMVDNPTHFRLAAGLITVQELYKEEAGSAINLLLKKAAAVADNAMKTRNNAQFSKAIVDIVNITAEIDEFEKGLVVNDDTSEGLGDGKAVTLDKLFDNINTVAEDLKRVDVKKQVSEMVNSVDHIVRISEETKIEEILEMIPEDVPAEQHSAFGQKIAALYRRIAKLGADVLKLWKVRADSLESVNKVGTALIALVVSFEKAITASATSLSAEQKAQLSKALVDKGFEITL